MPTIPTSRRQVREQAVAPGQVSATGPRLAQTNIAGQASKLVGQIGEFVQREQNKAMDSELKEIELQFINQRDRSLLDSENGFMTKRGKTTSESYNDYNDGYGKFIEERIGAIQNPELKRRAELMGREYKQKYTTALDKHTAGEMERHYDNVTKSTIESLQQSAVLNYTTYKANNEMHKLKDDVDKIELELDKYGVNKGMSPEQIAAMKKQASSSYHANIVKAAIQNGDDLEAKEYFQAQVKAGKVEGETALRMNKLIDQAVLLGESQSITGDILAMGLGQEESLAKAKEMAGDDPKLYDAVRNRVKNRLAERETIRSKQKSQLFEMYSKGLEASRTLDDVKKTEGWLSLDQKHRQALESRESQLARGINPKTDNKTYYELKLMASAPETKEQFLRSNLMQYRHKLSDSDFKRMADIQADMIKGGEAGDKAFRGLSTATQIQKDLIKEFDLDKSEEAAFRARLDEEVEQWKTENDSKVIPNTEIRKIGSGLLKKIVIDEGFVFDTKKRRFQMTDKEIQNLGIDEVPEQDKNQIKEVLKEAKLPVNDDVIVQHYRARLRKGV